MGKIYLDNENARHDPIDNEPEIIAHLVSHEKVKPLAAHIAKIEATSPLDRVGVFPHPVVKDSFVSAEGNRRLCALKLLSDPDKSPEGQRTYFRNLSKGMAAAPTHIEVVIFRDRADARPWLELRHEGPQGGIGTVNWNTRAKVRHNLGAEKPKNPNLLAVALLQYAQKRGLITKEEHDGINVTTVTRFLTNPIFRDALGIASIRDLSIVVDQGEFDRATERFLRDSLKGDKTGVTSRTNAKQREQYAHKLRKEQIAPTTRLPDPVQLDPLTGKSSQLGAASRGKAGQGNNRNPDKRLHIVQSPFTAHISNKVLVRIYQELREVDCQDHTFAAAYLLRAMIEVSIKLFCRQHGIGTEKIDLAVLIGQVCDKLLAQKAATDKELKPLRVIANNKHGLCAPDTLGSFVHGGSIPTGRDLNRSWDSIEGCMKLILARLK